MVRAMRLRLLSENPARYMTAKVPTSETGTVMAGMAVARALRRNTKTTRMTSTVEMTSERSTSRKEARMVGLRSITTCMAMAAGMAACKCGSSALTRSTVPMMLAPGWR